MDDRIEGGQGYVLGNHPEELARLEAQAASIEQPTRVLLQASGLTAGMRVLDLGTGLGHVARLAGEIVGPTGTVIGIDRSADVLAVARERTALAGLPHVTFVEGNVTEWRASEVFDAIVGRLLLFHVPDPVAVVRHHVGNLRPGGLFVAIDFDLGSARAEPPVALVDMTLQRLRDAFRAAGAWPRIGARLGTILEEAALTDVTTFGIQPYVSPRDASGSRLLAAVVRSLAPAMVAHGIATEADIDITTLEPRLAEALRAVGAVILLPTVAGAWGRVTK